VGFVMSLHSILFVTAFFLIPGMSNALGCPAKDGTEIPGLEAMNAHLLDGDYQAFAAAVKKGSNDQISLDMSGIESVFPEGFDTCTTIAQRYEPAGLNQSLVVFRHEGKGLYAYWLLLPAKGGMVLHTISLDTDPNEILKQLH
jgi:hypothetical protein